MAWNDPDKVPYWYPREGADSPHDREWPAAPLDLSHRKPVYLGDPSVPNPTLDDVNATEAMNQIIAQVNRLNGVQLLEYMTGPELITAHYLNTYLEPCIQSARLTEGIEPYEFTNKPWAGKSGNKPYLTYKDIFEFRDALNVIQNSIKQVSGGMHHTTMLKGDTVYGWGCNQYGQANPTLPSSIEDFSNRVLNPNIPIISGIKSIKGYKLWTMAISFDNTLYGWGQNTYGGVNPNAVTNYGTPSVWVDYNTPLLTNVKKVAIGSSFSAGTEGTWVLTYDGNIHVFGYSYIKGSYPHQTRICYPTSKVFLAAEAIDIASGVFLKENGNLYSICPVDGQLVVTLIATGIQEILEQGDTINPVYDGVFVKYTNGTMGVVGDMYNYCGQVSYQGSYIRQICVSSAGNTYINGYMMQDLSDSRIYVKGCLSVVTDGVHTLTNPFQNGKFFKGMTDGKLYSCFGGFKQDRLFLVGYNRHGQANPYVAPTPFPSSGPDKDYQFVDDTVDVLTNTVPED